MLVWFGEGCLDTWSRGQGKTDIPVIHSTRQLQVDKTPLSACDRGGQQTWYLCDSPRTAGYRHDSRQDWIIQMLVFVKPKQKENRERFDYAYRGTKGRSINLLWLGFQKLIFSMIQIEGPAYHARRHANITDKNFQFSSIDAGWYLDYRQSIWKFEIEVWPRTKRMNFTSKWDYHEL